jgi:hypothetical protein
VGEGGADTHGQRLTGGERRPSPSLREDGACFSSGMSCRALDRHIAFSSNIKLIIKIEYKYSNQIIRYQKKLKNHSLQVQAPTIIYRRDAVTEAFPHFF